MLRRWGDSERGDLRIGSQREEIGVLDSSTYVLIRRQGKAEIWLRTGKKTTREGGSSKTAKRTNQTSHDRRIFDKKTRRDRGGAERRGVPKKRRIKRKGPDFQHSLQRAGPYLKKILGGGVCTERGSEDRKRKG